MIREIIQAPDDRLLQPSAPVSFFTPLGDLMGDLINTRVNCGAAGLSAVQIGIHLRVVATNPTMFYGFTLLINPEITLRGNQIEEGDEGCMSIRSGVPRFRVKRHKVVTVRFFDRHAAERVITAHGFAARMAQHEIDHLDGKLIAPE